MEKTLDQTTDSGVLLFPERVLRRKPPLNLIHDESDLFSHEFEQVLPPVQLRTMHDVWASAEGLLFKDGQILPESFAAPFLLENWKTKSRIKFLASNYLLRQKRTIDYEAAWIVDDWSDGYYHWFADTLPRLYAIRDRAADLPLLLPHRLARLEFVQSSLKAFKWKNIQTIEKNEVYFCRQLVVPMHTAPCGQHDEDLIRGLRDLLVGFYGSKDSERSGRVYISRSRAHKRRVVNEEAVTRILRGYGFEIVVAESLSFADQVKVCSSARYLVSNHGAGLTNMMFLAPGSYVLELRNRNDREYNCYFNLASALHLNYFYQTCESDSPDEDAHLANLLVDEEKLRGNLGLIFGA